MPKDASIEQTNCHDPPCRGIPEEQKRESTKLITTIGQSSDGMGASQSTAYKAEIDVQLVPKTERQDEANIYAVKTKRELEKILVGAKVKDSTCKYLGYGRTGAAGAGGHRSGTGQCDALCQCSHGGTEESAGCYGNAFVGRSRQPGDQCTGRP